MLSTSSRPAAVCALLLEQSGQLLATDGRSAGIGNQTSTTAYWGGAPELDAIISDAKHIQLVPEDEAVFSARVAMLALANSDSERAALYFGNYQKALERIFASEKISDQYVKLFPSMQEAVLQRLLRAYQDQKLVPLLSTPEQARKAQFDGIELAAQISWQGLCLFSRLDTGEKSVSAEEMAPLVLRHVEYVSAMGNRKEVLDSYERFVQKFPKSIPAADMLVRKGDYSSEALSAPTEAIAAYRRAIDAYNDDDPISIPARLKLATALLTAKQADEAYALVRAIQSAWPKSSYAQTVNYIAAMCLASMELKDEAFELMKEIVDTHPDSAAAPQALFWLGIYYLDGGKYDDARAAFAEIRDRYPDIELAQKAVTSLQFIDQMKDRPK